MKYGEIIVEKREYELLKSIMGMAAYKKDKTYHASLSKLAEELKKAKILKDKDMPEDVVRFNSVVTIQTKYTMEKSYRIVTPEKSNLKENLISVLAPMGLALFGYAKGDEIMWQFPTGMSAIKITDVEQMKEIKSMEL
ncbi:MAG TPA: GreA/GreB family elongation factor [Salinimicrobium sp.]|nr:GreA/GreB family elongation factor [Salinimicrobium sp.]